jgi:hypothetical protein
MLHLETDTQPFGFVFLVHKTNRRTLSSNFIIGILTLHVLGSLSAHRQAFLSHTMALVHFMQFGDRVLP